LRPPIGFHLILMSKFANFSYVNNGDSINVNASSTNSTLNSKSCSHSCRNIVNVSSNNVKTNYNSFSSDDVTKSCRSHNCIQYTRDKDQDSTTTYDHIISNPTTTYTASTSKNIIDISSNKNGLDELYKSLPQNVHVYDHINNCENMSNSINSELPLKLLLIGHNPSKKSWIHGHYYANPSNRLWSLLSKAMIIPSHYKAHHDQKCPYYHGIGFTDVIINKPDSKSSNINSKMLVNSIQSFYQRLINHCHRVSIDNHHISIESCCPKVIAFVGVRQWKALFNDSQDKFNDGDNSDDNGYNDDDNCDDNYGNDNNSYNADIESNDNSYHSNVDYSSSNHRTNLGKHSFGINKVLGHSNKKLKSNHGFIIKNQDDDHNNHQNNNAIGHEHRDHLIINKSSSSSTTPIVTLPKSNTNITYGIQKYRPSNFPSCLSKSIIYVLPSSSGAAAMTNIVRESPYIELGTLLKQWIWQPGVGIIEDK